MLPFWSNYLIRTYAWIVLLNSEGLINCGLAGAGRDRRAAAAALQRVRHRARACSTATCRSWCWRSTARSRASTARSCEASADLGASSLRHLRAGDAAADRARHRGRLGLRVRAVSIGNFVTPDLLGGGQRADGRQPHLRRSSCRPATGRSGAALAFLLIGHDDAVRWRSSPGAWARRTGRSGGAAPVREDARSERRLWLSGHLGLVYLFLYGPIVVLVVLSFNRAACRPPGPAFRSEWYGKLLANEAIRRAVGNTLIVAVASTIIATVHRHAAGGRPGASCGRTPCSTRFVFAPMIIPDIVLAIALLSLLHAAQHDARPALDRAVARRLQHRLRRRGGAHAPQELRPLDRRGLDRSRRRRVARPSGASPCR